jgi:uncharacterized delta-60 repeat protein
MKYIKSKAAFISILILIISIFILIPITPTNNPALIIEKESPKLNSSTITNYDLAINKTWNATNFDVTNDIAIDARGNIYITGFKGNITGSGPSDAFLAKFDSAGNHIWNKTWDSSLVDEAEAIALDKEGNIYITGYNRSLFSSTAFIAKYDTNGNSLKNITWSNSLLSFANDIALDNEGNIYITGTNKSIALGPSDAYIAKFNSTGHFKMEIVLDVSNYDYAYDIELDNEGNIYIAGSNETIFLGPSDSFIAKFNSTGYSKMFISHQFISSSSVANALDLDKTANIYIAGYNGSILTGTVDAFIAKYDSDGNFIMNVTNHFYSSNIISRAIT